MPLFRRSLSLIAPLALGLTLASCGSGDDATKTGSPPSGQPVATVAPPAGQSWSGIARKTDRGGYLVGNSDAPIKLVEYGSLTCPACAAFANEGAQPLLNDYVDSGRVSFEFRSFVIHGPVDLALTRLIGCGAPEQALPLAEQVWANLPAILDPLQNKQAAIEAALAQPPEQRLIAVADTAGLIDFFAARGLSRDQARSCLSDTAALSQIAQTSETYGTEDDINHTPTFVLGGRQLEASTWAELEPILQRAGAR